MEARSKFSCSIDTDKKIYHSNEQVQLSFQLTNNNDYDVYVLNWHTPLEGLYNRYLVVSVDGKEVDYRGIMAKRGNPTADSYILVVAGQSVSSTVEISSGYDTSIPGRYLVLLKTNLMDVMQKREGVKFVPNKLGDMKMEPLSCGPVLFDVVQ